MGALALRRAALALVALVLLAGSADRVSVWLGIDYQAQIAAYRIAVLVLPALVGLAAYRTCVELRRGSS